MRERELCGSLTRSDKTPMESYPKECCVVCRLQNIKLVLQKKEDTRRSNFNKQTYNTTSHKNLLSSPERSIKAVCFSKSSNTRDK
jgi:hypothetical protein